MHLPPRSETVLLLLLLSALSARADSGDGPPLARPHVPVLMKDTTQADRCFVNGYRRPTTPFPEELAGSSTVFRNCLSSSPWTGSSHATIFTGRRPDSHGFIAEIRYFLLEEETKNLAPGAKARSHPGKTAIRVHQLPKNCVS